MPPPVVGLHWIVNPPSAVFANAGRHEPLVALVHEPLHRENESQQRAVLGDGLPWLCELVGYVAELAPSTGEMTV